VRDRPKRRFARIATLVIAGIGLSAALLGSSGSAAVRRHTAQTDSILQQAKAFVAASTGVETKWDGPTAGPKAVSGKKVVVISCDQTNQVCKAWAAAVQSAAKVLGWKSSVIDGRGTPTGWQSALQSAIALHPDGIVLAGVDATAEHQVITQGKSQGVAFVGMHAAALPGPKPALDLFMNIQQFPAQIAKLQVDEVIARSQAKGNVVLYYDSQYAIAVAKDKAYRAELSKCHTCRLVSNVNFPIASLAKDTPSLISSWVSRFPKPFYVVSVGDSVFDYMPAALQAGGVSKSNVLLVGADGTPPAYQRIRQGNFQIATVPEPADFEGWMALDELNRAFAHAKPAVFSPPVYLVTKSDINKEGGSHDVFNPSNHYAQHYKAIWGVK
jgi:ribose transport system substrate-binding protein